MLPPALPRSDATTPAADGAGSALRLMAELMPQLVWSTTADGYHDYFNERWYAFTGMPRPGEPGGEGEVAQGWNWKDFLHPDDFARTQAAWQHALATGAPYEIEYRLREAATGAYRWFLARALPVRDASGAVVRWFGTCTDVDDAKHSEAALGVLADAGAVLAGARDVERALAELTRLAVPRLGDWCAIDLLPEAGRPASGARVTRRVAVTHLDPEKVALAQELVTRYPDDPASPYGVPAVLRSGESQLMRDIPDELLAAVARDAEHLRIVRALGLKSAMVVPIVADDRTAARADARAGERADAPRGRVLGALTLVSAEAARRYADRDLAAAEELARRVGAALERARLVAALEAERARLAEQGHELATQNEALQQQAVELEMQAAQLQEQAAELEAQADELQGANFALGASEAQFRSLFESMTQGVVYHDADGRIVDANPAALRMLGLTAAQLLGRDAPDAQWRITNAAGAPLEAPEQPAVRALRSGEVVRGVRIGVVDPALGEQRWLLVDAVPETLPGESRPFRAYALISDVTEQVRADAERQRLADAEREARQEIARVFEQAPVAISVTRGPRHVYEMANDSYRRLLPGREVLGRPVHEVIAEITPEVLALLDGVYASGEPYVGVELPLRYDRRGVGEMEEAFFNLVYQPLCDAHGAVTGVVTVATEVTDQVLARRALERARASAEEANAAKSQFLRTVSHELRTPLNAIAGYADLVLMGVRGPVTDGLRGDVERIKRASQHLLGLINDILSFAKLEAGQVELDVTDVELAPVVAEVEALLAPQMAAKSLAYESAACAPGLLVHADAERVRQVLLNLLGNALKFTAAGGRIAVECRREGDRVAVRVRDTGVGIPPESQERIFDPFVQVGRDLRAPSEGVGLGLAISRDLARRMGGDLTVESRVGDGSTFTLTLPVAEGRG